jgi:ABC transporter substrate binding protein
MSERRKRTARRRGDVSHTSGISRLGAPAGEPVAVAAGDTYRSAEDHPERLPELAAELVRANPDVLITGFGTLAAKAARAATTTIPIVITSVGDPIGAGMNADTPSAPILQRDLSLFKGYGHQFDFDACMRCRSAKYIYCQSFRPAVSDLRKWGKTVIVSDPYTLGHLSLALSLT